MPTLAGELVLVLVLVLILLQFPRQWYSVEWTVGISRCKRSGVRKSEGYTTLQNRRQRKQGSTYLSFHAKEIKLELNLVLRPGISYVIHFMNFSNLKGRTL